MREDCKELISRALNDSLRALSGYANVSDIFSKINNTFLKVRADIGSLQVQMSNSGNILKEFNDNLEQKILNLQIDLNNTKHIPDKLVEYIRSLSKDIYDNTKTTNQVTGDIIDIKHLLSESNTKFRTLYEYIKSVETNENSKQDATSVNNIANRLSTLAKQLSDLTVQFNQYSNKLTELETQLNKVNDNIRICATMCGELKTTSSKHIDRIQTLLDDLTRKLNALLTDEG